MIGAKDLATVLEWTAEHDITVTMIGDPQQLQSVDASGPFGRLHAARPGAELTENLRQQTDIGRECAAFLRDGHAEEALLLLADAGQLVVATSQTHAEQILISAWAERAEQAPTPRDRVLGTGLESDRNDQVDILNTLARQEARQRGWITGTDHPYTAKGTTVAYADGDHILITTNIHRGRVRRSPMAPAPSSRPSAMKVWTSRTGTTPRSTPTISPPGKRSPTPDTATP